MACNFLNKLRAAFKGAECRKNALAQYQVAA
jgi:hypothetical protein